MTYLIAELMMYGSGVTAIISLALTTSAHSASTIMDPAILKKFWSLLRYCFNLIIVFLAAFKVGRDSISFVHWEDINAVMHSYFAKLAVRALMVTVLYPVLCSTGYMLNWKQCVVLIWTNFKGAVMMGISLSRWQNNINVDFALKEEAIRLGVLFLVQAINSSTLPTLMHSLDLVQMSEAEKANINTVVNTLRNAAKCSTEIQRKEKTFSGADWKWIQTHTFLETPRALAPETKNIFQKIKPIRRRSEVLIQDALRSANTNILRLQKVCYNKQYEDGLVHKKSKTTILAALQFPLENETYLTVDLMMPYILVPSWIDTFKDILQQFAGMAVIERRSSRRTSSRFDDEYDTAFIDLDFWSASINQGWYQVLVGFVATGFVLLLSGLAIHYNQHVSDGVLSVVTIVQGIYVFLYALEILLVVYSMGMFKIGSDAWRRLDLIIFGLIVAEFVLTSFVTVNIESKAYALFLMYSFILLIMCRTVKTLQKRVVLFLWMWDMMDGVLNRKLFYAYDLCWAYITAEDEAMSRVGRFVPSTTIASKIRESCGGNKLRTLKTVIDIQQKYPNIEVATKTRQAARRILNKSLDALYELHDGGLLDDKQFAMLYEDLTWMIHKVDGMPCGIRVGNTSLCMLLSVPWLPDDIVQNLLDSYLQCYRKGHIMVFSSHEHDDVSIICSGIVKVHGKSSKMTCSVDGKLANSDSYQYYFTEGNFKDYLVAPDAIGIIGFLTCEPSVCQATCETDVESCTIPTNVLQFIVEHHPEPPTVIYRMWLEVSVRIAMAVLVNHKQYQDWTHDRLKKFLQGGIMPNLYYAVEFTLDDAVQDVILIQGSLTSSDEQEFYLAPAYIPQTLRKMKLPDISSKAEARAKASDQRHISLAVPCLQRTVE
ncbi:sperm-specific sodium:proton exchanger-like isoform X2 [Ornithodoros turicata]|uniref:sperm-specific sodium:proton exchanger-like isoform X2 n=1 Tax=Ornithodoros turicata TaxID=34597 RepID=UPI003139CCF2